MRTAALFLVFMSASGNSAALAQSAPAVDVSSDTEEVIVRGRRLTDLRFEVEQAEERAYAIFNEINSDDDFDVYCRDERRYHSRATQRTCRPQFENRISSSAAREYLAGLFSACRQAGGVTQECMFSNYGAGGLSAAQGVEGELPSRHEQMRDEILRVAREDDRFAQAILDWYEKAQQYDAARTRRGQGRPRD